MSAATKEKWIIVDEVQKLPTLLDGVHHVIEKYGKFFALTGSSARKLRRGGAYLLAGRALIHTHSVIMRLEWHLIQWGSLPKIFSLESIEDRKRFLDSYSLTYIKEELAPNKLLENGSSI